jgi:primosomal protein N' (replication factor Y) (superfamily II helicase)
VNYVEVLVASLRYHKPEPLTYVAETHLPEGSVVAVPLQKETVLGVVSRSPAKKPRFATKLVHRVIVPDAVPSELLALHRWLADYYPAPYGTITQLLVPSSLLQQSRTKPEPKTPEEPTILPPLTAEQQTAAKQVEQGTARSFLLHGETGSGKTRVYLELTNKILATGRSVIILTPEIGLTPQLEHDFAAAFPGQAVAVHSTLTPAQRRESWLRIATSKQPLVVIGPRSALFSPLHNIGLIVIDEMHDTAYKQEQAPHYQATRVAGKLAELHNAKLVLGSATPSVGDYYTFKQKGLPILRMQQSALPAHSPTETKIVNLRDKQQFSRSPWFSDILIGHIQDAIREGQQSLIFLNRRGSARLVICQDCGWQATCPHCDLPLTYHADNHALRCHTCGFRQIPPGECPECGSSNIIFRSIGTKALVSELGRLFPKARIQRFDSDTHKSDRLENHYQSIRKGEVDILVGTQMLSKGLDLPLLRVVGVVIADTGLYFPDYTAEERTFQMLTQVMGRVGRGHGIARVVVQTYSPESPAIKAAIDKNYQEFYASQLLERQAFHFPPFFHTLKLSCARASSKTAEKAALGFADTLKKAHLQVEIIGPAPAFTERRGTKHHWQLIIKSRNRGALLQAIKLLPANWTYDIDPTNLL